MSRRRAWAEDSTTEIELTGGASFTLSFKGNLFDLTHEERELIASISSIAQQYQNGSGKRAKPAPEKSVTHE